MRWQNENRAFCRWHMFPWIAMQMNFFYYYYYFYVASVCVRFFLRSFGFASQITSSLCLCFSVFIFNTMTQKKTHTREVFNRFVLQICVVRLISIKFAHWISLSLLFVFSVSLTPSANFSRYCDRSLLRSQFQSMFFMHLALIA